MSPSRSLCPSACREPWAPSGAVHAVGGLGREGWKTVSKALHSPSSPETDAFLRASAATDL